MEPEDLANLKLAISFVVAVRESGRSGRCPTEYVQASMPQLTAPPSASQRSPWDPSFCVVSR